MRTTLHYIVDGMAGPLVKQQLMKYVNATAERVLAIIKNLLTALEAGKVPLDRRLTNVEQLLRRLT
ncbi:MAG: hypothetical protein ACE5H0_02635 [Bacteroidota bacterium]